MRALGLFLLLSLIFDAAFATTLRVPSEYPSIQPAIDACAEGDTVLVAPGTYVGTGNRDLDFGGTNLVLKSEGGSAVTILRCLRLGRGFLFQNGENAASRVEGFTIHEGCAYYSGVGGGIYCLGASPTLVDLLIENCRSSEIGGGMYCRDGNPVLDGIVFHNNIALVDGSIGHCRGGGLYCRDSSPKIMNSVFLGNWAFQVLDWECCSSAYGGGFYSLGGSPVLEHIVFSQNRASVHYWPDIKGTALCSEGPITLYNVTVYDHEGCGAALHFEGGATVEYCIVAFNTSAMTGDPTLNCCDFFGNESGDEHGGSGTNFSADPLFCGAEAGDFHLSALSPCLPENNDCEMLVGALGAGCFGEEMPYNCTASEDLYDGIFLSWNWDGADHTGFIIERDGEVAHYGNDPGERDWMDEDCAIGGHDYAVRAVLPAGPGRAGHAWGERLGEHLAWLFPSGGEFFRPGEEYHFYWEETDIPEYVDIELSRTGPGGPWELLFSGISNWGTSPFWTVTGPSSDDCYLRISDPSDGIPSDVTAGAFTIAHRSWHVPYDYASIQEAISASISGDTVLVAPGIYYEHDITVEVGVSLRNDSETRADVVIDAGGLGRILNIDTEGAQVIISGIEFHNGNSGAGGAIYCEDSPVQFQGCSFHDNAAGGDGGAVHNMHSALSFDDCIFENNQAGDSGGGLYCQSAGAIFLLDSSFTDNRAEGHGGGVFCGNCNAIELTACSFQGNSADQSGGGIFVSACPLFMQVCTCEENQAGESGGAAFLAGWVSGGVDSCTFLANVAGGNGGAIRSDNCAVAFSECVFANNSGGDGGGLYCDGCNSPSITGCTFAANASLLHRGAAISTWTSTQMTVGNTIIAFSTMGKAVDNYGYLSAPQFTCSDIYGNAEGDWIEFIADQEGANGNISLDPLFCDLDEGDLRLQPESPCLPENNECGVQIGALGEGCEDTPVFLSFFDARPGAGSVYLTWETAVPAGQAEFRLLGAKDDLEWQIAYEQVRPGVFQAEDESSFLIDGGSVTYTLYGREAGEDWQLLRTTQVEVSARVFVTCLLDTYPNPFNPQTTIPFTLREKGRVSLTVYDIAGRRVACLADEILDYGQHLVVWDGRNDRGHAQSSGVYLVQMKTAGYCQSRRLILLR